MIHLKNSSFHLNCNILWDLRLGFLWISIWTSNVCMSYLKKFENRLFYKEHKEIQFIGRITYMVFTSLRQINYYRKGISFRFTLGVLIGHDRFLPKMYLFLFRRFICPPNKKTWNSIRIILNKNVISEYILK